MCGAYFCMGGYKRNGVAEIKMGAYIHQVLFFVGAYYPDFTVIGGPNALHVHTNFEYTCSVFFSCIQASAFK